LQSQRFAGFLFVAGTILLKMGEYGFIQIRGFRMMNKITRRKVMDLGVKAGAVIGASRAFGNPLFALANPGESKTVHGACYHDCPDSCSWTVTAVDGKITNFAASKTNPYTAGKLCNKMDNFPSDVTFHPNRILTPLKRTGAKGKAEFKPISWEDALKEISARLKAVIQEHGGESVLPYSYGGTEGLVQSDAMSGRFFARIGASKLEATICGDAAVSGVAAANGDDTGVLPEDIVHSRYILLWGTNPIVSNQHLWPLILKAKQSGAKIVVVDPFQSATAQVADRHIQLMPGTDAALALSMIHVILTEGLQDQDYIDRYTLGIQELKDHVKKYDPISAGKVTGLEPEVIVSLAKEYSRTQPSLIRLLIGIEKHAGGANACRAIAMLPALTGAWRRLGGGLMHLTFELYGKALNWERLTLAERIATSKTRKINMVQIGRALNDSAMKPPLRALFVFNSNPAVIAPDQNQVLKGLQREDLLTVVAEHFLTDTARYADFVLPATTQLEHWDLQTSWAQDYINLNPPVISPRGQSKSNSQIFRDLAKAMDFQDDYFSESDEEIIRETLNTKHPYMKGITFESLMKTGWARLQLPAPWIPHAEGNFATKSKKCEFVITTADGMKSLPEQISPVYSAEELKKYPLQLLSIKSTRNFLNTSHANVRHLLQKEGIPYLDIHDADAKSRGISDGDAVKVHNARGHVLLTARIKNKVRMGIVCMPQGFWPSLMKGGSSANALTTDALTDMGNGSALQETRVEVTKV
jgi:anaerobic selenocysteine-containing dehydrogenase